MGLVFRGDADAVPRFCVTVVEPGAGRPRKLPLRLELSNHSPTGFGWGYDGAAPAQLALAILAEVTRDNALAVRLHQDFKRDVIAGLAMNHSWQLNSRQVREWLSAAAAGPAHLPGDAEAQAPDPGRPRPIPPPPRPGYPERDDPERDDPEQPEQDKPPPWRNADARWARP